MEKECFDKIMNSLNTHIADCRKYFKDIKYTSDLCKLTINQLAELVSFSRIEYEKMTVILMVDLYHIIGMGNLSAVQLMLFMKAIKEYGSYRPIIQIISTRVYDLFALPIISGKHSYTVRELGKVKLVSYLGDPDVENEINIKTENVDDVEAETDGLPCTKSTPISKKELPFTYDALNQSIMFRSADTDAVLKSLAKLSITVGGKPDVLINKATNNREYLGLKLSLAADGQVVGRVVNACLASKFRKALNTLAE